MNLKMELVLEGVSNQLFDDGDNAASYFVVA